MLASRRHSDCDRRFRQWVLVVEQDPVATRRHHQARRVVHRAITPDEKEAPPLLQAVAALGTALGLPVLAEGVETAHQAAIFARIGFELAQGFYFARGLPLFELKETLAAAAILPSAGSSGLFP